jgi:hypothetical protein
METPATVRVEELGRETSSYRDAIDERRRVLHVRAGNPEDTIRTLAGLTLLTLVLCAALPALMAVVPHAPEPGLAALFTLFSLLDGAALAVLVPATLISWLVGGVAWAWRRAQWARFELGARTLSVSSGPIGWSTSVSASSARRPIVEARVASWVRDALGLRSWDLYVEREGGGRVHLATVFDGEGLRAVTTQLASTYSTAEPIADRHPFAARFGPIPDGVHCDGDLDDPRAGWTLEACCTRESLVLEVIASLLFLLGASSCVFFATAALHSAVSYVLEVDTPATAMALGVVSCGLALMLTAGFGATALEQLRLTLLRWRGRVRVVLGAERLEVTTSPWRSKVLVEGDRRASERAALRVIPVGQSREARLAVQSGGREMRVPGPMGLDEARYLAKIVEAFEAARIARTAKAAPERAAEKD